MQILAIFITIILIVVLAITLIMLIAVVISNFTSAPFLPSNKKALNKMIEMADLNSDDIVYDLGSGDGKVVIAAARHGIKKAVGFETNPILNLIAKLNARFFKVKNVEFVTTNLFNADLSKCNKVFVYLLPKAMAKLETKIMEEMPNGGLVISNTFRFKNLVPTQSSESPRILIYKISK